MDPNPGQSSYEKTACELRIARNGPEHLELLRSCPKNGHFWLFFFKKCGILRAECGFRMRFASKQASSEEELSEKHKWQSLCSSLRACSRKCSDPWCPSMLSAALLRWHAQEGTQECEQVMAVQEACLSHRASVELYCSALPDYDQLIPR